MSHWYDLLTGPFEKKLRQAALELLQVKQGQSVLEIGCGTGEALKHFARQTGEKGKVYGLDLSPRMLSVARKKLEREGLLSRVALECGDALHLPFSPDSFDVVFLSFTLELFDNHEVPLVLEQVRRVLKSGGRLGVVALSKVREKRMVKLYEWVHKKFPKWLDCRPIFVREALLMAGFVEILSKTETLMGLPVEIVVADNNP
jgi:demethylmenaquinone methyltransferase/2-methoxy-6-polyprenyl-1,4-benzoquinol methylase